jgi:hypothetical protein
VARALRLEERDRFAAAATTLVGVDLANTRVGRLRTRERQLEKAEAELEKAEAELEKARSKRSWRRPETVLEKAGDGVGEGQRRSWRRQETQSCPSMAPWGTCNTAMAVGPIRDLFASARVIDGLAARLRTISSTGSLADRATPRALGIDRSA